MKRHFILHPSSLILSYTAGMKALARLEGFIQELVERPAWLLTARRLHPLEMAAAITRALESAALPLADRVIVPDAYVVQLGSEDFGLFDGKRATLEREFAEYVGRLAVERGLTLNAAASVAIVEMPGVRTGTVQVRTRFSEEPPQRRDAAGTVMRRRPPGQPGLTERVAVHENGPAAAGVAALEVVAQDGAVLRRIVLPADTVVIGRRAASAVMLDDPEVSRRHARVEYVTPRYYISDLGSTNGTFVNGRKVNGRHPLTDGDTIDVGQTRLRFRRGG
jgi:FHA domain/FhaA, N-terminal domain